MEELIDKVEKLIDSIDNSSCVNDIKDANSKVYSDNELLQLLKEYTYNKSDAVKEKIMSNPNFRNYKEKETDLNIMIMSINQKLKAITNGRSCGHESH